MPVAYGIFLAVAQKFLQKPNNVSANARRENLHDIQIPNVHLSKYGLGSAVPIARVSDVFDGSLALVWADGTNGTGVPSPDSIMSKVTAGFTPAQLQGVKKVATPADIPSTCPQNFNLFSECFAAIAFNDLPAVANGTHPINYTTRADGGLYHIDVVRHSSDFERRILPLQWAVDQASRYHTRVSFHLVNFSLGYY
jgi:ATP-binding cassette, subfamily A (ABC1), member 3